VYFEFRYGIILTGFRQNVNNFLRIFLGNFSRQFLHEVREKFHKMSGARINVDPDVRIAVFSVNLAVDHISWRASTRATSGFRPADFGVFAEDRLQIGNVRLDSLPLQCIPRAALELKSINFVVIEEIVNDLPDR
jgi:hypothetical protein